MDRGEGRFLQENKAAENVCGLSATPVKGERPFPQETHPSNPRFKQDFPAA